MQLPENSFLRALSVVFLFGLGLVGVGYALFFLLIVAVSMPSRTPLELSPEQLAPAAPGWTTTTEIYLRNRTAAPLRVVLTVARPALLLDTVWWGLDLSPEAIGQALVLRDSLATQGLCYPLPVPVLLPGTADTLIDKNFDDNLPRALVRRPRYNSRPSADVRARRYTISQYLFKPTSGELAFGQATNLQCVPVPPDSLRLLLDLAPAGILRVGRCRVAYTNEGGLLARADSEAPYFPPSLQVQQFDTAGHCRPLPRPPLARLLALPAAEATLPRTGHRLVRRYWDCR